MVRTVRTIYFLCLCLFLFTVGCAEKTPEISSISFQGMGTVLSVIYAGGKNAAAEAALKSDAAAVEADFSYYRESSYVSLLNREAAKGDVKVPDHVCRLVEKSIELGNLSGGFFDITYKSTGDLWENNGGKKPDEKALVEKQKFVGSGKVVLDCKENRIRFAGEGVRIDLGGIAKGYAIDRAAEILKKHGINDFIVNYGGDMTVCGSKAPGKPWAVGVKDPDDPSKFLKRFEFGDGKCRGIATSGDYERFFTVEGETFSHIIDPKTGIPIKDARSVTVIAENALEADVAATAVSVALHEKSAVKKIMEKFGVKIYTLIGDAVWTEW